MILQVIRTLITYVLVFVLVVIFFIPTVIFILLPARWRYDNKLFFWMADIFYKLVLFATFVPIKVIGKENIPKDPSIIVANHQSSLDVPLVGSVLNGFPHLWLAWAKLQKSLIGAVIRRMAVLIDPSSSMRAMRSLIKSLKMIEGKHRHAIIFPEGGRYEKIHDFFSGFVIIAKRTKRPVVPILLVNAYEVYPPGSFLIHRYPIKIVVGKAFFYKEGDDDKAFAERVHRWFVDNFEAHKE